MQIDGYTGNAYDGEAATANITTPWSPTEAVVRPENYVDATSEETGRQIAPNSALVVNTSGTNSLALSEDPKNPASDTAGLVVNPLGAALVVGQGNVDNLTIVSRGGDADFTITYYE